VIQVATYYWVSTTPGANASAFAQWSSSPSGSALGGWPGSSPDASDDFVFDHGSTANCNWDIAAVQSIQQSLVTAELYTGIITIATNIALKGLILNGEITDAGGSKTLTFSGANLSALNDTSSRKRYVLNGKKAKHGSGSTLLYKIQPASNDVHLDNGPYNKLTIDSQTMTLAYSVPTASTHDNADDGTIHIKGAFVAAAAGGFVRASAPNGALDAEVKIKFDNTTFTYPSDVLDFNMATAFFRGIELPVTGSQTYGSTSGGFTAKHYGLVVFAASNGEQATIRNGLDLNCFSLEVKAGARLTCQSDSGKPVQINSQMQPTIRGVWSFQSSDGHTYISPRTTYVAGVGAGGTGLKAVQPNGLLIGNNGSATSDLVVVPPGTNGHVLTLVAGVPTWAASSGGGGSGTVTSVATSAPITGGTITGSGTIGISAATTSAAGSMSSADKTKLDGIEAAADVTDTSNVTSAGALMDSEVTNLAQVKAFNSADYATAAQGAKADSAQQPPSEGAFANGDKTKLDTIETNADVTDTANVTAAGALMDSEVTNLAAVKAFDPAAYATAAQGAKADTALQSVPAFQHLRLNLTNNSLGSQASGTFYYLDLANTSNYTSTGNTTSIIVTNDTQDYISLAAGGMYMVVVSVEIFTAASTAAQDFWVQLGNGVSSNAERRRWGTVRQKVRATSSSSDCAMNMQKTVIIDVASTGSDEKLYVIPYLNGASFEVKAYDDNRTNITVTRIGDSTS
jgi:hypothetical protein